MFQDYSSKIRMIPLNPPIDGFNNFLSSWLYSGHQTFLIDTGPAVTVPNLLNVLEKLSINRIDYILLTHIHIDHAGGIGHIANAYPDALVVCESSAIKHLVDPSALWEGTLKTLKDIGRAYGPMQPVDANRLIPASEFKNPETQAVLTPGHAPHHVSYLTDECLFAGEVAGVVIPIDADTNYSRPATPPRFYYETTLKSIDTLISMSPGKMALGHFGFIDQAIPFMQKHKDQLAFWLDTVKSVKADRIDDQEIIEAAKQQLLNTDPLLSSFYKLPPSIRKREDFFIENSLRGFVGYLK